VPTLTNRQIVLRRRPRGLVEPEDTELVTMAAPEPAGDDSHDHLVTAEDRFNIAMAKQ